MLLKPLVYILFGHMFSFPWSKYLGVELLDYMEGICLTFSETAKMFSKVIAVLIFCHESKIVIIPHYSCYRLV